MKLSARTSFVFIACTLLLGSSLTTETTWYNPLKRQMRFYQEDSPQFNLASHLFLDKLDRVSTDQCGEATYRGLTDETTGYPNALPYTYKGSGSSETDIGEEPKAFKGCSRPKPVAIRNHYAMLCGQTNTLILVKTSRTKSIEVVSDFNFSELLKDQVPQGAIMG